MENRVEFDWSKPEVRVLISLLEKYPVLYKSSHKDYLNINKRKYAFKAITEQLQDYKPECTVQTVKNKIKTLRSQARIEMRSIKSNGGLGADKVYKPKLWCYNDLRFLIDAVDDEKSVSNVQKRDNSSGDQQRDSVEDEPPAKIKKARTHKNVMAVLPSQKETDSFEYLGLAWAAKLRNMHPTQSKLAERLVSEVLFQGDMGMLTMDTTIQSNTCYSQSPTPHENLADGNNRNISEQNDAEMLTFDNPIFKQDHSELDTAIIVNEYQ